MRRSPASHTHTHTPKIKIQDSTNTLNWPHALGKSWQLSRAPIPSRAGQAPSQPLCSTARFAVVHDIISRNLGYRWVLPPPISMTNSSPEHSWVMLRPSGSRWNLPPLPALGSVSLCRAPNAAIVRYLGNGWGLHPSPGFRDMVSWQATALGTAALHQNTKEAPRQTAALPQ